MQITPEQLLAEAGRMALEIRLKDQALGALVAENARLLAQLAEHETGQGDKGADLEVA
jgi:hypothetical protein